MSIGRQIGLRGEIEFPSPEDNKAESGELGETLKRALKPQVGNTQDEL